MHWPRLGRALPLALLAAPAALSAQTIDDALMMPHRQLCTGFIYTHDSWDRYWEGSLERSNGNIGTVTTQTVSWMATYGVTDRLNVIAMVPWVTTHASAGVLVGMHGVQDLTVALKWNALSTPLTSVGTLQAFAVVSGAGPLSDYTPDFQPLSIGTREPARLGARQPALPGERGLVRRGHGRLHLARQGEARPAVLLHERPALLQRRGRDAGRRRLHLPGRLLEARALRADLLLAADHDRRRRHPPPGRAVRVEPDERSRASTRSSITTFLPRGGWVCRSAPAYVPSGRNVGQSTTLLGGVTYIFRF